MKYREFTSTSFVFKNGFFMYHVEVRKVRENMTSSFFPESSRELGEWLKPSSRSECVYSRMRKMNNRTMNKR